MEKSFFNELRTIGIDEEAAAHVQAALNGEVCATNNDVQAMQRLLCEQHKKIMAIISNQEVETADSRPEVKQ